MGPERKKAAYDAVQRAIALQDNGSEAERAYINALAFRYSKDPNADLRQLDVAYRDAMAKLVIRYPDDLDAVTLYAESMMLLHPWQLWLRDGRPNEGTEEIVAVLESVLARDPNHLGANHYYVHAIEASPHPERALASAARLEKLAPAAGHLTHMPSHIYSRVGNHIASARVNANAVTADQKFIQWQPKPGMEAQMLSLHNLHFLAYAHCMNGSLAEAKGAADRLAARVQRQVKEMPMLEGFLPTSIMVLLVFERWNDILKLPAPDSSFSFTNAMWRFGRGVALANLGKTESAEKERAAWQEIVAKIPPDTVIIELNTAEAIFKIHENLLAAAIARSRRDDTKAIGFLTQAVTAEDALNYSEPPSWFPSVRPMLGRILLAANQAAEAEKVFRADLDKNPRHHRALAGLRDALNAQRRNYEAAQIAQQLGEAQKDIDAVSSVGARR
jgi:tetratricopeptide (TPR) repeat protein